MRVRGGPQGINSMECLGNSAAWLQCPDLQGCVVTALVPLPTDHSPGLLTAWEKAYGKQRANKGLEPASQQYLCHPGAGGQEDVVNIEVKSEIQGGWGR